MSKSDATHKPAIAALLVAAGAGSRFGAAIPKQYTIVAGKMVIRHAAEALLREGAIIQPVGDAEAISEALAGLSFRAPVAGGETRQDSVRNGLEALADLNPDIVLVHDAARPVIPAGTVADIVKALEHHAGAIPGAPIADTIKRGAEGAIVGTLSRDGLYRAQTPQGFRYALLRDLHRNAEPGATDDAAILEAAGHAVALVAGHDDNIKLTYPEDRMRLERILAPMMETRIGTGFDVHVLAEGRKLILCGVDVPHDKGLDGHSDADVGIHALCDAIYGAMADGDIGRHFPPSENQWKDADSARFLRHAAARVAERGGRIVNVDVTLICERPKIAPHAAAMMQRLADLMGIDVGRVSVKATTTERLGFTGRMEGIAAQAAVSLLLPG